jgi:hypothetical protein
MPGTKNRGRKLDRGKLRFKLSPIAVLFIAADNPDCLIEELVHAIKAEFRLTEDDFQYAVNYSFVPSIVSQLLLRGWLLRKWDGKAYTFCVTAAGHTELQKH